MEKKLKIVLCIVVIILITVVAILGVYTKDSVLFKNHLPEILLSSDFEGKRVSSLVVDDGLKDVIFDSEGKEVKSIPEGANEADYKKEQVKINPDENLKTENYKKVKEILDGRLKSLGVGTYTVRLDENTGNAAIELEENFDTDNILLVLTSKGDFSITDSESGKVLLGREDLKNAKVLYNNANANGVVVYLNFAFNKEGAKKLNEISKEYILLEPEEGSEEKENPNQKKVTLTLEGAEMLTTSFGEEITSGELTLTLGTTTDSEDLQEYVKQASFYAALLNNEEMPLTYKLEMTEVMQGNLTDFDINVLISITILIGIVAAFYLIVRYKADGVFATINLCGALSLLMLAVRYTATEISVNSVGGIILIILFETYLLDRVLNSIKRDNTIENIHKATLKDYLKHKEAIAVLLITSIVFTFMQNVEVFTFGMTLFYGTISIGIANLVFLRTMLLAKYSKN